jgi:ribosomal protein S5
VLIFIGNSNGVIGYAKGKGLDHQAAFENAFKQIKRNLIAINLDLTHTTPNLLYGKHNDYRLWIYPRTKPNFWGSPQIWHMLVCTGFYHCRFVVKSRNKNAYSLVYAFFAAVCRNKTPQSIAEYSGRKIYHTYFGDPGQNTKVLI